MKCTKCGNEYEGKFCPECGAPAEANEVAYSTPVAKPKKKGGCLKIVMIALFAILALLVLIVAIGGSSDEPASDAAGSVASSSTVATPEPEPEYIEVTAKDLLAAYDENTVAADNTYKGQLLKVTGTVGSIGKDILDSAYVTLTNGEPYALVSVQCYFAKDNLDDIATLKEGDTVTITGKCDGSTLNVALKQCDLVVE